MIYVVEIPHQSRARAWFAFDQEDFARKVRTAKASEGYTLFAAASPRQQLQAAGHTPESASGHAEYSGIFELADLHGWDTVLYRADYLLGQGVYQAE
ncbi:MAG: uncharacterized protein H6R26_332, partial [Proteobacteria bacterium]|nr:uncharacterized protein [Pseudomonadota bacterium]